MPADIKLVSALNDVIDIVNAIPDFEGKKAKAIELISALRINDTDKRRMLMIINYQCPNSTKLTMYLYNSKLKYEGLGSLDRSKY